MTPQESIDAAAVMIAFAEGKKIEMNNGMGWHPCPHPIWDWECIKYRVAAEPWQGKIWVHHEGSVHNERFFSMSHKYATENDWRLITAKEVQDD